MNPTRRPLLDRLVEKIELQPDGCWLWTAALSTGYGVIASGQGRRLLKAHRVTYEWLVGPIPKGLTIDHLCRNRACVNPGHLESVTLEENKRRGESLPAQNARKTHCPNGHPYDLHDGHTRRCRICLLARRREYGRRRWSERADVRAKRLAYQREYRARKAAGVSS